MRVKGYTNHVMPRYGLATLLEIHPVGYTFTAANVPLHLTHVDSFEVNLDIDELKSKLQQILWDQQRLRVKAVADTLLGPNKDIPVTMLELTPALADLHKRIMDMLEIEGATLKNPHFHREFYGPHVSIYGDKRVALNHEVLIKDLSIGVKTGEGADAVHHIVATIPFG